MRNIELAYNLCENLALRGGTGEFTLEIGEISWWLDWFNEFIASNSKEWMFTDRVPSVLITYVPALKRKEFVSEFNNANSKYRKTLSSIFLKKMPDLKITDFTEESLLYLFEELKTSKIDRWNSSVLIDIATEQFVVERMLPLLKKTDGNERENLISIIQEIGKQHKRRYLIE